jgi:hypothetical protein
MIRHSAWFLATVALVALAACSEDPAAATTDTAVDAVADTVADTASDTQPIDTTPDVVAEVDAGLDAPDWTPDRACNTGGGVLPKGLDEIAWDDGVMKSHVKEQTWSILGKPLVDESLYEAVRFDLDGPMKIWGFRVQFGSVAEAKDAPVTLGLYRDFGHNGFDFWAKDPIWTVSRCGDQVAPEEWVDYRLPQPVVIDQPGLVYVASLRKNADSPALAFDGTLPEGCEDPNNCCGPFDACHSAWNLPDMTSYTIDGQLNAAWNGLSMSRPVDYLVRLLVEPTAKDDPLLHRFKAIPDIKPGGRQSWGDFDGDGWDDMWDSSGKLWRNDKGTLVDVTEGTGITALAVPSSGGVWGDYDNDGDLDLLTFVESSAETEHLLRNDNGKFVDVTLQAGLGTTQTYNLCGATDGKPQHEPTAGAAWLDLDADGFLDLYLANFNCWTDYTFYVDRFWHNNGDGTFQDRTVASGFPTEAGTKFPSRGVTPADFDSDGDVDIFVHTYVLVRDLLFRNEGNGKVKEVGQSQGVAGKATQTGGVKRYGHGIGSVWGDLNGDGRLDLVVANLAHPRYWDFSNKSEVLLQQADGTFQDIQGDWQYPAGAAGLTYQETHSVPVLGDFDQDGDLDLLMSATYDGRPTEFYLGNGDGTFTLSRWQSGIADRNGWGMAAADLDHDGDPDLACSNVLYENRGSKGNWLQVRVVGDVQANRAGIGATVRVTAGGKTWMRVVDGGSGQGGQSMTAVHVGLGTVDTVESIEVVWPGGKKTTYAGPFTANQRVWVAESGKVTKGWSGTP